MTPGNGCASRFLSAFYDFLIFAAAERNGAKDSSARPERDPAILCKSADALLAPAEKQTG
jgi:hypothetical protein